jgi:hypothetical protein
VRQTSFKWYFTVIMVVLLITIPGDILTQNSNGSAFSRFRLPKMIAVTSDKVRGLFDCTMPSTDNPTDFTFRANLVPTPNNGLINPRENPPVWERTLLVKQKMLLLGFFFAIMVISLFFIFYQNSRNGSEGEDNIFTTSLHSHISKCRLILINYVTNPSVLINVN